MHNFSFKTGSQANFIENVTVFNISRKTERAPVNCHVCAEVRDLFRSKRRHFII